MTSRNENESHSHAPLQRLLGFLQTVTPFNNLAFDELKKLVQRMELAYFPRGELILGRGDPPPRHLYIIQHGAAKLSLTDEADKEVIVDIRGEADYFGATSILQAKPVTYDITAQQDLIILMLPADDLKQLAAKYPEFQRFFSLSLARTIQAVRQSAVFQSSPPMGQISVSLEFFMTGKRVADLMSKNVLTCAPGLSIRSAARLMAQRRVSSIVVTGNVLYPMGIVTDNDLRTKVLAVGLSPDTTISRIMNHPVITIAPDAFAFDALLTMSRHGVRLLVVTEDQRVIGILSEHDLQMETGSSPLQVIGEIERSDSLGALTGLRYKIDRVLEMLLRQGGPVKQLTALVTELNDRLTLRILKLVERQMDREGLGKPPASYGWLAFGSEGRKEQTLHTDQDNALFFSEDSEQKEVENKRWFLNFSERVVENLVRSGIPRCPGGVMASNQQWCQTEEQWQARFLEWIAEPNPDSLLMASIFFDFRPIYSGTEFPYMLQERILQAIRKSRLFLRFMAKVALINRPPLGLLKQFVVEKTGEHKNKLDLKLRGLTPIVYAVRVLGLELGIKVQNTFDRLSEINRMGVISDNDYADLKEAYEFIVYLQITRHLDALSKGEEPDNFLDPASLNSLQRKMLKESFSVVRKLQGALEFRFQTNLVEI
jgi:CBS domain-containing protein